MMRVLLSNNGAGPWRKEVKSTPVATTTPKTQSPHTDEEDEENDNKNGLLDHLLVESPSKRIKMGSGGTPSKRTFGEEIDANNILDPLNTSIVSMASKDTAISGLSEDATVMSDCGTEVSSVAHLRGWLDDFGKQHKQHYEKVSKKPEASTLEKPTRPKVQKAASSAPPTPLPPPSASALAKRLVPVDSSKNHPCELRRHCRSTPVRIKPKIQSKEVQATNDGYASVAKLSAWLADDPTTTKKVKQIRRGANIIAKSRKFDKGLANVVIEQNNIQRGTVSDKKEWLQSAFSEDTTDDDASHVSVPSKRELIAPHSMQKMNNESASVVSVNHKKQWLANAFKKPDGSNSLVPKAQTDINTAQDERDDVTSRAKQMWRSKCTPTKSAPAEDRRPATEIKTEKTAPEPRRLTMLNPTEKPKTELTAEKPKAELNAEKPKVEPIEDSHPKTKAKAEKEPEPPRLTLSKPWLADRDYRRQSIASTPSMDSLLSESSEEHASMGHCHFKFDDNVKPPEERHVKADRKKVVEERREAPAASQPKSNAEEEEEAPNFHAARKLLVARSKKNGNKVDVLTKVNRRKARFEKMSAENRRKSAPIGLLKPSWEEDEEGPTNCYIKKYVDDVAPKKSFEELP